MRILVVEDKPEHRESAQAEFGARHDVVVVASFERALEELAPGARSYDVLLCGQLLPMSDLHLTDGRHDPDRLVMYGPVLVLTAIRRGVPYIGVLTDLGHHHHHAAAAILHFCQAGLTLGTSRVVFVEDLYLADPHVRPCDRCQERGLCGTCEGAGRKHTIIGEEDCPMCAHTTQPGVCPYCEGAGVREVVAFARKDWAALLDQLLR